MSDTADDPRSTWAQRVADYGEASNFHAPLRKRGRRSGAELSVVTPIDIDARRGRPPAPERFAAAERQLWEQLTHSRRPGWFNGAEALLAEYVVTIRHCEFVDAALAKARQGTGDRYTKLMRQRRQLVTLAASLATRLRLTPSARIDKRLPHDGNEPIM